MYPNEKEFGPWAIHEKFKMLKEDSSSDFLEIVKIVVRKKVLFKE